MFPITTSLGGQYACPSPYSETLTCFFSPWSPKAALGNVAARDTSARPIKKNRASPIIRSPLLKQGCLLLRRPDGGCSLIREILPYFPCSVPRKMMPRGSTSRGATATQKHP